MIRVKYLFVILLKQIEYRDTRALERMPVLMQNICFLPQFKGMRTCQLTLFTFLSIKKVKLCHYRPKVA
jgi:hypothetical protein